MLHAIIANIGNIEALGKVEINLYGRALPAALQAIADVEIDLRPVENPRARVFLVGDTEAVERFAQNRRRDLPLLVGADRILGPRAQENLVVVEAESPVEFADHTDDQFDLAGQLLGRAEVVGVVLSKTTNPE